MTETEDVLLSHYISTLIKYICIFKLFIKLVSCFILFTLAMCELLRDWSKIPNSTTCMCWPQTSKQVIVTIVIFTYMVKCCFFVNVLSDEKDCVTSIKYWGKAKKKYSFGVSYGRSDTFPCVFMKNKYVIISRILSSTEWSTVYIHTYDVLKTGRNLGQILLQLLLSFHSSFVWVIFLLLVDWFVYLVFENFKTIKLWL